MRLRTILAGATIFSKLTTELVASRTGRLSCSLVTPQLPTRSHAMARITYGPWSAASSKLAIKCDPSKVVGNVDHAFVPTGAICSDPLATPDSPSETLATTWVGAPGLARANPTAGGASSIFTTRDALPVAGWPCGPTARFQSVHDTVCVPSPSTVIGPV